MDYKESKLEKSLYLVGKSLVLAGVVVGASFMLFCKCGENSDWRNASRLENDFMYYAPLTSLGLIGAGMLSFFGRDGIRYYRGRDKK